jgi:hypothetical protein
VKLVAGHGDGKEMSWIGGRLTPRPHSCHTAGLFFLTAVLPLCPSHDAVLYLHHQDPVSTSMEDMTNQIASTVGFTQELA